jgi:hypothetical protein
VLRSGSRSGCSVNFVSFGWSSLSGRFSEVGTSSLLCGTVPRGTKSDRFCWDWQGRPAVLHGQVNWLKVTQKESFSLVTYVGFTFGGLVLQVVTVVSSVGGH